MKLLSNVPSRRAFAAGLAAVASAGRVRAQEAAPLRIGAVPVDSFAEAYYAREAGFFAKSGIAVEIVPTNGAGSTTAFAAGAIDIGIATVTTMTNAVVHGIPLVYIAAGALFAGTPTTALLVAKNGKLAGAKDFVGKTVAVAGLKDATHLPLVAWLIQNNVDPAAVAVIEMPFSAMVPAIARGTIDGAVCTEPFVTAGADDARILTLVHSALGKRYMTGGWYTSPAWLKANGPLARRFVGAIYETARWANANHAASGAVLQKVAKIDPAVIAKMARTDFAESLTPDLIQPSLDWAFRAKFLDRQLHAADLIGAV